MSQTETDIMQWFHDTALGQMIRDSTWMFASLETIHFIGLCMLLGSMLVVDLRLVGFLRGFPIRSALAFLPFALGGFALNLLSGIGFVAADPFYYWPNPAFRLKMYMVLLAGLNALLFTIFEHKAVSNLDVSADTNAFTKVAAVLSLALWVFIIILGRSLPTFEGSTTFF
jgi:hypothetical protein